MLTVFQVILLILILLFSLGVIGEKDKEKQFTYVPIVLASVLAMVITFFIV